MPRKWSDSLFFSLWTERLQLNSIFCENNRSLYTRIWSSGKASIIQAISNPFRLTFRQHSDNQFVLILFFPHTFISIINFMGKKKSFNPIFGVFITPQFGIIFVATVWPLWFRMAYFLRKNKSIFFKRWIKSNNSNQWINLIRPGCPNNRAIIVSTMKFYIRTKKWTILIVNWQDLQYHANANAA